MTVHALLAVQMVQYGKKQKEWRGSCTSGGQILEKPFEGTRGRYQLAFERNV